ncbi:MAG: MoaD/ThiS family protein [Promethearchaeota archaeon]
MIKRNILQNKISNLFMMFKIKISFLSLLVDITGREEIFLALKENSTIRDLLQNLIRKFGKEFENTIFISPNNLSKYVILSLNGKAIHSSENLDTNLYDGDEIIFLPAIAGG